MTSLKLSRFRKKNRSELFLAIQIGLFFLLSSELVFASAKRAAIVSHQSFFGEAEDIAGTRIWRAPNFINQKQAMGWETRTFEPSVRLQNRVQFWKDIYTKYSTRQGVIHDSEYIDLVYAEIDFSDIEKNASINIFDIDKLKKKRLEDEKAQVESLLNKLAQVSNRSEIKDERDKRVWDYFSKIDDPDKFKKAANKDRIRFQLGLSDRMQKAIFVSGRYLEEMEVIFKEEGIPAELTRLVFVESSFNVLARSKVGASGLWQIMPSTARPYGYLRVNGIDKRNHPMEATRLAAKILRSSFSLLQSWPLAVTAYNHGPNGVKRLALNYHTNDLGELIDSVRDHESFGFASKNFFASFLAALEVEKNAPLYFKNVVWSRPFDAKKIVLSGAVASEKVMSWFKGDEYRFQVFNPHISKNLLKTKQSLPKDTELLVPSEKFTSAVIDMAFRPTRKMASIIKKNPHVD